MPDPIRYTKAISLLMLAAARLIRVVDVLEHYEHKTPEEVQAALELSRTAVAKIQEFTKLKIT